MDPLKTGNREEEHLPDITFEPPTPLTLLQSSLQVNQQQQQQQLPQRHTGTYAGMDRIGSLTCDPGYVALQHQQNDSGSQRGTPTSPSPYSPLSDHIFAWQDSHRHSTPEYGPRSESVLSVCSFSGTSASEEYHSSLNSFVGTDCTRPASACTTDEAASPSQSGKSKSHARKRAPGHIARPRNAFILFRSHAITHDLIPSSFGVKDNRAVSCIVASLWHSLPEEEKSQWRMEAQLEKEEHQAKYPNYQFKPDVAVSSKAKTRQHAKPEEGVKEQCALIADQILKSHGRTVAAPPKGKGRSTTNTRGNATSKIANGTGGLPRAKRTTRAKAAAADALVVATSRDASEEYVAPTNPLPPRRRTSSAPDIWESREASHHSPMTHGSDDGMRGSSVPQQLDIWQEPMSSDPAVLSASFDSHFSSFQRHMDSFREERGGKIAGGGSNGESSRPCNLDLTLTSNRMMNLHDDHGVVVSPYTVLDNLYSNALTCQSENLQRSKSDNTPCASRTFFPSLETSGDAMLVSPMQATFQDLKKDSLDWQWSRLSISNGVDLHPQRRSRYQQASTSTLNQALGGGTGPRRDDEDREGASTSSNHMHQSVTSPSSHYPESATPQSLSFPAGVFDVCTQ